MCQAAHTPGLQTPSGATVNELPVMAHGKLHRCFEERRQDTCLLHIWLCSPNKGKEQHSAKDRAWRDVVQGAQCPGSTITGSARARHKLPAGSFYPLTQSTPRKAAFYPARISEDEKLSCGKTAKMLRVG